MRFISLFSGIGGIDLAFERAGMSCQKQVEIDSHCQRVLKHHWPKIERTQDVTQEKGEKTDLVCGGFPCQDLSSNGKRAGLAGHRSGLFFEFARILEEATPLWFVVENVAGLLSSNEGRDMGTVLATLGDLGYGWAYRLLDSRSNGIPQARKRIYIVGRHKDTQSSVKVLFDEKENGGTCKTSPRKTSSQHGISSTQKIVCIDGQNLTVKEGYCGSLLTRDPIFHSCGFGVVIGNRIRSLTPIECLRLQGFPDSWLSLPGLTNSRKYHMLGNSVCVPTLEWIGRNIMRVEHGISGSSL